MAGKDIEGSKEKVFPIGYRSLSVRCSSARAVGMLVKSIAAMVFPFEW